jgi:ATP-dependent 26S proteasome regulatory subunit
LVKDHAQFAGFEKQVQTLKEIIDLKLLSQKLTSIKGVLVHGPAGIGKSHLIHSVLKPLDLKVIRVTPSHLISGDQFDKIKLAFK